MKNYIILVLCFICVAQFAHASEQTELQSILNKVASIDYTHHEKPCQEATQEALKELTDKGIQAQPVIGVDSNGKSHEWIAIWIEPQSGKPTEGYKLTDVLSCDFYGNCNKKN